MFTLPRTRSTSICYLQRNSGIKEDASCEAAPRGIYASATTACICRSNVNRASTDRNSLNRTKLAMTSICLFLSIWGVMGCSATGSSGDPGVVSVSSSQATIPVGKNFTIFAFSLDPGDEFSWSSSNQNVASVDDGGVVTGVAVGTAVVTATGSSSGNAGDTIVIVVPTIGNLLLFDGEEAFSSEAPFTLPNTTEPFRGQVCLEANPDQWHGPVVKVRNDAWRKDISQYDEIWFMAKASGVDAHISFAVASWPFDSTAIDIDPFIEGGALTSEYKLVRLPVDLLKTADYDLTSIERVGFGLSLPGESYRLFIDEVWAINLDTVGENGGPLVGILPNGSFGDIDVPFSKTETYAVSNIGSDPLVVNAINFSGDGNNLFVAFPNSFSVAPGQSQDIQVTFAPDQAGDYDVVLNISHSETAFGNTTEIPLTGTGRASRLALSHDSIDFGEVPAERSLTIDVDVTNTGNEDLRVDGMSTADAIFTADTTSLVLIPGETRSFDITVQPTTAGTVDSSLNFTSNDPNAPTYSLALHVDASDVDAIGKLPLLAQNSTSNSVEIDWGMVSGADEIRVFIGPEPSSVRDASLPLQYQIASLAGTTSTYTIQNLAADADVFVRVEAYDTGALVSEKNMHVRTVGGPRANLASPLREVHLVAPNIIQVVLTDLRVHSFATFANNFDQGIEEVIGDRGAAWQAGTWTVLREDGGAIAVQNVYRHSQPIGAPYYEHGYGTQTWDNLLDIDHSIYLELAEPVGNRAVLHITGPSFDYEILTEALVRETRSASLDFLLPFSDRYLETPVIQVNQVGYSPRATRRYAYVSAWLGDGGPLSLSDFPATADVIEDVIDPMEVRPAVVSNLSITVRSASDTDAGTEVREISLASVPAAEGTVYRVRIPGVGVSWQTQVSEMAVFKSFYTIARGMFLNRFAGDLRSDLTEWSRAIDHGTVYTAEGTNPWDMFNQNTPLTDARALVGGHHDAGDFDIRIYHGIVAMMLMRAFEVNQSAFLDGQLNIPESGNGIPDLLDEALWSVAAWEALQEGDGGVRIGVESFREPWGVYFANEDPLTYWTYSRDAVFTCRVAGLFAQASRLVAPYSAARANVLQNRAVAAYDYAINNGVDESTGGPIMYAAGELFRLTGETRYSDVVSTTWEAHRPAWLNIPNIFTRDIPWTGSFTDPTQPIVWDHVLGYIGSPAADPAHVSAARLNLAGWPSQKIAEINAGSAHRHGRPGDIVSTWGKASAVGQYLFPVYAAMQEADLTASQVQDAIDTASLSADYVLGCNPAGRVWITGLGSRPPQDPLHLDSLAFIGMGLEPMPGIPVYGPVEHIPVAGISEYGARLSYPLYANHPPLRRYGDVHFFIPNNEFSVWESQAPHVELFAILLGSAISPPADWLPGGSEHRNPYPPRN